MVTQKVYEQTLPGVGRRRASRYPIPANVMVIPLDGRTEPLWATAEDISSRGVFISIERQPPIDSVLLLKIVVRSDARPLRIKARVVHQIRGIGIGCKFIDMTPTTSKNLSGLVAEATSAPPVARALDA